MATKKGLIEKAKDAIVGVFSSDAPAKRKSAKKAPSKTGAKKVPAKTSAKKAPAKKAAAKKMSAKPVARKASAKTAAKKVSAKPAVKKAAKKAAKSAKRGAPVKKLDRKLIALSEPYEIRDWCKSMGCTEAELRAAVGAVGPSAAKVRSFLKSAPRVNVAES